MAVTLYIRSRWLELAEEIETGTMVYDTLEDALAGATAGHYIHTLHVDTNHVEVQAPKLGKLV